MAPAQRTLRVTVGPASVAIVFGAIAAATATFAVAVSARRVLGWAVACAVVAFLLDPLVRLLDRHMPRILAILLALVLLFAVFGGVVVGVLEDLGNQFDRLQEELPKAAAELEDSGALGGAADDLRLEERVQDLLTRLEDPRSGLAETAASSGSAYLVCVILTIFFLSWGPRAADGALTQISDSSRRAYVRLVGHDAVARSRRYLLAAVLRAIVTGVLAWGFCYWEDVPAPIVSAVAIGVLSVVPGIGIVVGGLAALVLEAGLGTPDGAMRLAAFLVALQAVDVVVSRRLVTPWSAVVGPAPIVIAMVVGFEVYGFGGAMYAIAIAVFAMAVLDAAARHAPPRPVADSATDVVPEADPEAVLPAAETEV